MAAKETVLPEGGQGRFIGTGEGGEREAKARNYIQSRNHQRVQPLIRSQIEAAKGGTECFIYNVSRIFEWRRPYQGFGTFVIPRAPGVNSIIMDHDTRKPREATEADIKGKYKLSAPVHIAHSYVASYDKGDTRRIPYVEYGEEIAESVVGNSALYPADLVNPTSNLENWGVFITYGKPYEDLPKAEQDALYIKAQAVHQKRCFEKVLNADTLFNRSPACVLEIHRLCALEIGEERRWVTQRAPRSKADTIECPFCTSEIKPTALVCPQCRNVVNQEAYDKRTAKK
jgi:hypothetical protein